MGLFPKQQLEAMATGLEMSGQRFLWVVRSPRPDGTRLYAAGGLPEPDLGELLPEGFLERTKDRGLVEEARVGVEMIGYDREVVTAEEVEAKVRWVMDSEHGRALRALRARAMVAKEMSMEALQQGGTSHSHNVLLELLADLGFDECAVHHTSE